MCRRIRTGVVPIGSLMLAPAAPVSIVIFLRRVHWSFHHAAAGCGESVFGAGVRPAVNQVFPHRAAEKKRLLQDDADLAAQVCAR